MIPIQSTKATLEKILGLLKKKEPFCYTRFGDSQLMHMDGWEGQEWEQVGSPKLQLLQQKAFEVNDPDYLIAPSCGYEIEPGMRSGTFHLYRNNDEMMQTVEKHCTTDTLWHCEAIHYGMLYNQELTIELFKEINKHKILVVSGEDLNVGEYFKSDWIKIPMANAFKDWEQYLTNIKEAIEDHGYDLVLFSAGMTSQILQYYLFLDMANVTTINMGSVFNALLEIKDGIHTRAWITDNMELIQAFKIKWKTQHTA